MARPILICVCVLLSALVLPAAAQAQTPVAISPPSDTIYEVRLMDGSALIARVAEIDGDNVVFMTVGGVRVEVERLQIQSVTPAAGEMVGGEYWNPDPADTRLFFTSTGRTLAAGEAYVGTYFIVLPFAAAGLTDRIEVYGGAPVIFGELEPYYLGAKVQLVRTPTRRASVGTLALVFGDELVGIAYGVGTFGSEHRAVSAGLGYFYSGDEVVNQPAFMLGAENRVSRRIKLITENYVLPDAVGMLISGGLRIIGDRFSSEIGIFGRFGEGETSCCFPLINFNYTFGR